MNRDLIFDGNRTLSPMAIILGIMGIWLFVLAPPLGLLALWLAWVSQRRFRRRHRRSDEVAAARLAEKQRRARIAMFKGL